MGHLSFWEGEITWNYHRCFKKISLWKRRFLVRKPWFIRIPGVQFWGWKNPPEFTNMTESGKTPPFSSLDIHRLIHGGLFSLSCYFLKGWRLQWLCRALWWFGAWIGCEAFDGWSRDALCTSTLGFKLEVIFMDGNPENGRGPTIFPMSLRDIGVYWKEGRYWDPQWFGASLLLSRISAGQDLFTELNMFQYERLPIKNYVTLSKALFIEARLEVGDRNYPQVVSFRGTFEPENVSNEVICERLCLPL